MSKDNPVLYKVGDIPIRKENTVRLKIGESDYKKIAEIANTTGLPISQIIALQGKPCNACPNPEVSLNIPKGLLSNKKANTGRSIINRLENGRQKQGS